MKGALVSYNSGCIDVKGSMSSSMVYISGRHFLAVVRRNEKLVSIYTFEGIIYASTPLQLRIELVGFMVLPWTKQVFVPL